MANKRVKIYERVKAHGKWTSVSVEIPNLKPDNTLYLKDTREGKFRISWYEGTRKHWHPTTCRTLGEALKVKAEKEWFLQNQNRPGVQDPTLPDARLLISVSVEQYVDSLTGSKRTKSAYGHAVREFAEWNASLKNGSKKTLMEEIDKAHMARFFDYLVDDEPENQPYTAALKLLRTNAFIRAMLKLDAGKGPKQSPSCPAQVLGVGYKHVGAALNGGMAVRLMVLLLVLKLLAVTTSYASGNAGGIFGPSLFIGAMLGGIVGSVAHTLLPAYVATPGVYALVGMGTAFAGIVRAPMTSVVMIFEITRDYAVIVPLMISNLVSFFISSRLQRQPIYEVLARQDGIHLPSAETRHQQGQRHVIHAMRAPTEILAAQMNVGEALEKTQSSQFHSWPVIDDRGVVGAVSRSSLQHALAETPSTRRLMELVDSPDFPHVHSDQSLHFALERMGAAQLDTLPVVSRADVHKLEGIVTLQDILDSYGVGGGQESE